MVKAPIPSDEPSRLQDLHEYGLLDSPAEDDFDDIVRLASDICQVPVSLITLIDASRQWVKARRGMDITETPRDISFCGHAMLGEDVFEVADAREDIRFYDNPFVSGENGVRFYAGVPLISPRGYRLGTLCLVDSKPHKLTQPQRETIMLLGKQVVQLMELRRKNRELNAMTLQEKARRLELERVSEVQKRTISVLAHDIRSPLGALKSLLQLIPDKKEGLVQSAALLQMAGLQLNATLSLLDNIIDWGQLQMDSGLPAHSNCALSDIVRQTLDALEIQAGLKGLTLINRVDPGIRIVSDEYKIGFILRNLVTNAIKFTRSGTVTVDAVLTRERVLLSVEDTGIGIPAAHLEKLFQGGRPLSRKGTQSEVGSGLGLLLVKEFADKLHGRITAESTEGKGTLIAIDWPRFI